MPPFAISVEHNSLGIQADSCEGVQISSQLPGHASQPQGSQQSKGSCAWRNPRGYSQKGREIHQSWGEVLCTLKKSEALHDKQSLFGGMGWNRDGMNLLSGMLHGIILVPGMLHGIILLPGVLQGIILLPGQVGQQETLTWACCAQGNTQPWALEPVIGSFTALMGNQSWKMWPSGRKIKPNNTPNNKSATTTSLKSGL